MPEMTAEQFTEAKWRLMNTEDYDNYVEGTGVRGVTLSAAQIKEAKKLHEWNTNDLSLASSLAADELFGFDVTSPAYKWGPEYWFAYFWAEAKESFQRADATEIGFSSFGANTPRANVLHAFNKWFFKPIAPVNQIVARQPISTFPDADIRTLLHILLEIGFKKVPIESQSSTLTTADHSWKRYCIEKDATLLEVAWRSEDRTVKDVSKKGGYEPQTFDIEWARTTNMSAAWHPFSSESTKGFLWYRLGKQDNCKYTVTSLAKELRVALGFPKLDKDNYPKMPTVSLQTMSNDQRAQCTNKGVPIVGKVKLSGGGRTEERWMIITKTAVAQVILEKAIFDTQQAQDADKPGAGFKEMGAAKIPLRNIVGWYYFYRVHHGITEPDGFTAVIIPRECQQPALKHLVKFGASEEEANRLLGVLQPVFQQTLAQAPIASAWGATGYNNPAIPLSLADGTHAAIQHIQIGGHDVWP